MRISDWSSDVCSSDLFAGHVGRTEVELRTIVGEEWRVTATLVLRQHIDFGIEFGVRSDRARLGQDLTTLHGFAGSTAQPRADIVTGFTAIEQLAEHFDAGHDGLLRRANAVDRSEEHTSELQSIMRISSAV